MYLRGSTLRNSFIIIDDSQNLTKEELHLILTRIGEGSKVVITGDLSQSDIFVENGLSFVIRKIGQLQLPVPIVTFTDSDICRSQTCQLWHTIFTSPEIVSESIYSSYKRL
jgi:phosphate starvation-inducible PhoH-like protein